MPELPEVETIRSGLEPEIIGADIETAEMLFDASMPVERSLIEEKLIGAKIERLRRRGKVLIIELDSGYSLLIHLKMTGQLILERPEGERSGGGHPTESMRKPLPDKSTRVIFSLSDGSRLYFNDQRKFGWIKLIPSHDIEEDALIRRMGPEPQDPAFTYEEFVRRVAHRRTPIKAALLNQENISGFGNIYTDEALHLACIHPETKARDLNSEELNRLHDSIRQIIVQAIKYEGTTFSDFMNHKGERGNYFDHARVFGRSGKPCPVCGVPIEKIRVAGRGTHICPRCQDLSRR